MINAPVLRVIGFVCDDPAYNAAFDEWYWKVHTPEALSRVPGLRACSGYEVVNPKEGEPRWVVICELDGPDVFDKYRKKMETGEAPRFTEGPPHRVVWRRDFKLMK